MVLYMEICDIAILYVIYKADIFIYIYNHTVRGLEGTANAGAVRAETLNFGCGAATLRGAEKLS